MPGLQDDWSARLGGSAANLEVDLDRFPELRQAVVPVNFDLVVEEGSYLTMTEDGLQGVLRGRLIPPSGSRSDVPPKSGAIGLEFDTSFEGFLEIETLDTPAQAQRRGLGRLIMAGIADLADGLGIEALILEASKTGRYAWARCGFRFMDPDEDRDRIVSAASSFAEALGRPCDFAEITEPWQLARVPGLVSAGEVEAVGGPAAQPGGADLRWGLGKALLLGPPQNANTWFGKLDPGQQSQDRVRLDAYARGNDA